MDKILVAGIDTVVGANLAAWLASRFQVVGLSWSDPISIAGCETAVCNQNPAEAARKWIASERPQWIIYCGAAGVSSWTLPESSSLDGSCVIAARAWGAAATEFNAEFTYISSDAVFTGPWMFHRETGTCFCDSAPARVLRLMEKEIIESCPTSLIVRTNVFGWSPLAEVPTNTETILSALSEEKTLELDCVRHATPILATDLAELLEAAYNRKLRGLYHIGGGERVSPFRFAFLMAEQFGLSSQSLMPLEPSAEGRREYGAGESSLQTRRVRKALEMPLPLIREGLARLHDQYTSGYRDRFGLVSSLQTEKVA